MRILIIHQHYLTSDAAGGSRWNQFAKYWTLAGHDVEVVTGMLDYSSGLTRDVYKGKFYAAEVDENGVRVHRCFVSDLYNRGRWGRLWGILTFMISSVVNGIRRCRRPDVIIATSPPLFVGISMWFLSRYFRRPCIFEVRDLHPDSLVEVGGLRNRVEIWGMRQIEKMCYRSSVWVNALTPAFQDVLVEKKNVPANRISMIPNGADLDIMEPGPKQNEVRQRLNLTDCYVIAYVGVHGLANHLEQLLDTAEIMKDQMPDGRILLVGNGPRKEFLVASAKQRNLKNVVFHDAVPKHEIALYIQAADVCTAVLRKTELHKTVYPNKLFDYMSCKKAVVLGIDGVARKVVEEANAGLSAEPENPAEIFTAIKTLRDDPDLASRMAESGLAYVRRHFSRQQLADKYLTIVERVANGKCPA